MIQDHKFDLYFNFKTGDHLHIDCTIVGVLPIEEYTISCYNQYTQQRWTQSMTYSDIVYLMYSPDDSAKYLLK